MLDSNATQITDGTYDLPMNGISVKGEAPEEGWIVIEKGEITNYSMKVMDYVITKGTEPTKEGDVATKPEGGSSEVTYTAYSIGDYVTLNDGTSWEDIQKNYKDKITFEDLGYQSWDASLEQSFMDALTDMDDNSYSKDPVKTSYGYHVIYRLDQKKAPKLKEVKEVIIENLITEKKSKDADLLYKALISLREEKNIKFSDTVMKEKYEDYCKKYK